MWLALLKLKACACCLPLLHATACTAACGLTNDFITGTASELRCSARKNMAKKSVGEMPKGRKRQRGHETRHAKVRIMHSWAWGRAVTHTYIPAVRHNKLFPMRVQAGVLLLRWPKVQNGNGRKVKKKVRRENRIKKATAMSWPEPEQRSRA